MPGMEQGMGAGADQGMEMNRNMEAPAPQFGAAPPTDNAAENPVTKALKDLQLFIAAQQENGNPRSNKMLDSFKGLLSSIGGADEQSAPGPQPTGRPEVTPAATVKPPMPDKPMSRQMPEHASMGAVQAL